MVLFDLLCSKAKGCYVVWRVVFDDEGVAIPFGFSLGQSVGLSFGV